MTPETFLTQLRQGSLAERLDLLATLREQARRRTLDLDAQIAAMETQKTERLGWMAEALTTLEAQVKAECLALGESVKGPQRGLQVIYSRGRVTWETEKLEGYAEEHPEVLTFQKTGTPGAKIV